MYLQGRIAFIKWCSRPEKDFSAYGNFNPSNQRSYSDSGDREWISMYITNKSAPGSGGNSKCLWYTLNMLVPQILTASSFAAPSAKKDA